MNNNELEKYSHLIFSKLFSIENEKLNREEQIDLIKGVITKVAVDAERIGAMKVINKMDLAVNNIKLEITL